MSVTLAAATTNALADQITTLVDVGAGAGTVKVYTGDKPATPDDTATGTLLATFTLADPAAAAAAAGVAAWDTGAGIDATVAADGTAGWFRLADSDDNPVADGDCGTTGDADLLFDSVAWISGETVTLGASSTVQDAS
jgi:hypothetical protein